MNTLCLGSSNVYHYFDLTYSLRENNIYLVGHHFILFLQVVLITILFEFVILYTL